MGCLCSTLTIELLLIRGDRSGDMYTATVECPLKKKTLEVDRGDHVHIVDGSDTVPKLLSHWDSYQPLKYKRLAIDTWKRSFHSLVTITSWILCMLLRTYTG